jgi:hypothetical protein
MAPAALTRRPAFWAAYVVVAATALAVAWRLFPLAIPAVHLDIKLGRADAIAKAREIAEREPLLPGELRAAAQFTHDEAVQNYVELEGGGKPAFAALVAGDVYSPYRWEVRLFAPGETTEETVRFRPDGALIGFTLRLPETFVPANRADRALDRAAAQALAERVAHDAWGVDFGAYRLLEATEQTRTSGRVDHAFVYERTGGHLGDSRFRLRVSVAGNVLAEVAPFVFIPESFERRFSEMRSANNAIAGAATVAAALLYGIGGCIIGVLWLARRHWLLWRPALAAGFLVGTLLGAASLSDIPGAWFSFDTAHTVTSFWLREVGKAAAATLAGGLLLALVFMAAESLSRRAFPAHPQLWRVGSREAAPTTAVLGRTLGGYLFVPIELAFIAAFYAATNRWLGWWQPSEVLTDPEILGSAVPALGPIALSLQAGFMEECLFRAVPLSLAALIGERFGHRTAAIAIAVVVQALVFAGGHASYPGFPSYSRLVELFVPAIVWALIFLRFGLVPTILLHWLFDLVLMSIPLFLVDAPGALLSRGLAIAVALVPLALILARGLAHGAWGELPDTLRNGAWHPAVLLPPAPAVAPVVVEATLPERAVNFQKALVPLGIMGFVLWLVATPFRADVPPLALARGDALALADAALAARGVTLGPEWRRFATVRVAPDNAARWQGHVFVWREAGPAAYAKLIGATLPPPMWEVRYARFDGDVAARAEEWRVTLDGRGAIRQVRHELPEAAPGARLSKDDALAFARKTVRDRFGLDPAAVTEIGAEERQRPARVDWTFTFAEPGVAVGKGGEARAAVTIAGDEVAAYGRYVFVPEQWQRAEREVDGGTTLLRMVVGGVLAVATLAALVMAVIDWTHRRRDRRALFGTAAIALALGVVATANAWPELAMNLDTTEPIVVQAAQGIALTLVGILLGSLALGLAAGVGVFAAAHARWYALATRLPPWAAGVAAGALVAGVGAISAAQVRQAVPIWPSLGIEALALPWLGAALAGARTFYAIVIALFLVYWTGRLTAGWQRRGWLVLGITVALFASLGLASPQDPATAGFAGALSGAVVIGVVYGLLRFDALTVPAFVATGAALDLTASVLRKGNPAAFVDLAVALAVVALIAWGVTRYLERARAAAAAAPPAERSS